MCGCVCVGVGGRAGGLREMGLHRPAPAVVLSGFGSSRSDGGKNILQ